MRVLCVCTVFACLAVVGIQSAIHPFAEDVRSEEAARADNWQSTVTMLRNQLFSKLCVREPFKSQVFVWRAKYKNNTRTCFLIHTSRIQAVPTTRCLATVRRRNGSGRNSSRICWWKYVVLKSIVHRSTSFIPSCNSISKGSHLQHLPGGRLHAAHPPPIGRLERNHPHRCRRHVQQFPDCPVAHLRGHDRHESRHRRLHHRSATASHRGLILRRPLPVGALSTARCVRHARMERSD